MVSEWFAKALEWYVPCNARPKICWSFKYLKKYFLWIRWLYCTYLLTRKQINAQFEVQHSTQEYIWCIRTLVFQLHVKEFSVAWVTAKIISHSRNIRLRKEFIRFLSLIQVEYTLVIRYTVFAKCERLDTAQI